jgi:hypothetical protein
MEMIIILCSLINGFLSGPLWVAVVKLVADCADYRNYGFYFSYFWSFYIFA